MKDLIKVTLDTNVIDPDNPIIKKLERYESKGVLRFYCDWEVIFEKQNLKTIDSREKALNWIDLHCAREKGAHFLPYSSDPKRIIKLIEQTQGWTFDEENESESKIRKIHSPEVKDIGKFDQKSLLNKNNDWKILLHHVMNRRDFFVTNNTRDFINFGKEIGERLSQFDKSFPGIKIVCLDEKFIEKIDEEIKKRGLL